MSKPVKKTAKKPVAKKVAKRNMPTPTAKTKKSKEPKMNFMMRVLQQREEKRKQLEQGHPHSEKPMPHSNTRSINMKNTGFSRFAGPRRKAG